MVLVPTHEATIGIDVEDIARIARITQRQSRTETLRLFHRSTPARRVRVPAFFIGRTEVTCGAYARFLVEHAGVRAPKHFVDRRPPPGFEDRPVTNVSFHEAQRYAAWLGRRLPTEIEWEAAARFGGSAGGGLGGPRRYWPWGDDFDVGLLLCNCDLVATCDARRAIPEGLTPMLPVGTFPQGRSYLGIDDLAGNAAEWVDGFLEPYPGFVPRQIHGSRINPADFEPESRVVRGGHANHGDLALTTVWRLPLSAERRSPLIGFRTAADAR